MSPSGDICSVWSLQSSISLHRCSVLSLQSSISLHRCTVWSLQSSQHRSGHPERSHLSRQLRAKTLFWVRGGTRGPGRLRGPGGPAGACL